MRKNFDGQDKRLSENFLSDILVFQNHFLPPVAMTKCVQDDFGGRPWVEVKQDITALVWRILQKVNSDPTVNKPSILIPLTTLYLSYIYM
jgi:hypothetical protein